MYKIGFVTILVFASCNVAYGQRTLGGLGAGGLDGSGFGDPIANDYAGIDWGYDFQTGMIINGYNPNAARAFANRSSGNIYGGNMYGGTPSVGSSGYWQSREPEMDAYFRMRMKNRMYRDQEYRYNKYRHSAAGRYEMFGR